MFEFNYLDPITEDVQVKIIKERMQYTKVYETIEQYLSKNLDIYLGGTMAVDLLLNKPRSYEDFTYELHSENIFHHANNIANAISEATESEESPVFVMLKTSIPYIKYQIFVNTRTIVEIYKVPEFSFDLIMPINIKSYMQYNILILSPEIYLIDVYRTLYSPNKADMWEEAISNEYKLFAYLKSRVKQIIGAEESPEISNAERELVRDTLLSEFIADNTNVILIGEHALKLLNNSSESTNIIHVISQNDIETDFSQIVKIIQTVLKRGIPVMKFTRHLHIMQDFRIKRTTIKVGTETQKEIIYIYNSASYDLIPYNILPVDKSKFQIGNPFVIMRFLLIEFWMVRLIKVLGNINETYAQFRQDILINSLLQLRAQLTPVGSLVKASQIENSANIDERFYLRAGPLAVFQKDYIGYYEDEIISLKEKIQNIQKKYFDYYPLEYKKRNGHYRTL